MPTESLLVDANDPDLPQKVDALRPVPGLCVFMDIVGSTAMKHRSFREWVLLIHNSFVNAGTLLSAFRPLKGIGDELMYYVEDRDLAALGSSPLRVFEALYQLATDRDRIYPLTKIVAAHCTSVYSMTFLRGSRDYYGIDIDRCARLRGIDPEPREREVVIDSRMYEQLRAEYEQPGMNQFDSFLQLHGPTTHEAKGIPDPIRVYRTVANATRDRQSTASKKKTRRHGRRAGR